MNKVIKSELLYLLSNELKVPQTEVKLVLDCYVDRLKKRLENGETVKFLNVCYLVNDKKRLSYNETLAYTSYEIGKETKLGKELVLRILTTYEDFIVRDIKKFFSYSVRGLVRIRYDEYIHGVCKVRINKATNLDSNIRVVTLNSFKRKVE